jgi:hypothetical protein
VPFHSSATITPPELPTATHELAAAHETPDSAPAPAGDWIVQLVPFHCSASIAPSALPTAMQSLELAQDTPEKTLLLTPVGIGTGTIVHTVPFHSSANAVSCVVK